MAQPSRESTENYTEEQIGDNVSKIHTTNDTISDTEMAMGTEYKMPQSLCFDGKVDMRSDWIKFKQMFKIYLMASGHERVAEARKAAILLNAMGQQAQDLYFNVLKKDDTLKYEEVIKIFDDYFQPQQNKVISSFNFNKRVQMDGENFDSFYTDLRKLAEACDFEELTDRLITDRIIIGLRNKKIQQKLLEISDLTLNKAVDVCRAAEISSEQVKIMSKEKTGNQAVESVSRTSSGAGGQRKASTTHWGAQKRSPQSQPATQAKYNRDYYLCLKCNTKHGPRSCPAYGKICTACNKYNHFKSGCKNNKNMNNINIKNDTSSDSDSFVLNSIKLCNSIDNKSEELITTLTVENKQVLFKLDSGAQVNVISLKTFNKIVDDDKKKMSETKVVLEVFGGTKICPIGSCSLLINYENKSMTAEFLIVREKVKPILGLKTCMDLELITCKINKNIKNIKNIKNAESKILNIKNMSKDNIVKRYNELFQGVGVFKEPLELHTRPGAQPVVRPPRRVPIALQSRLAEKLRDLEDRQIISKIREQAKSINLNVVVLKFSAHDIAGHEICSEYSWPINNMKSVATNPLKICKYSRTSGRASGGDDMILLVNKISKKTIQIRMFELNANNQEIWSKRVFFLQTDVHHQYAISFSTPAYTGTTIAAKVQVFIELNRETDGQKSEPVIFWYINPNFSQNKKRKIGSSPHCATGSSSPIASVLPTPRVIVRAQYCDRRVTQQCNAEVADASNHRPQQSAQVSQNTGVLRPRRTSDQPAQFSRAQVAQVGHQQTSDQVSQTGILCSQQSRSNTPRVLEHQQTSDQVSQTGILDSQQSRSNTPRVLEHQQTSDQVSQTGILGSQQSRSNTPRVHGHQQTSDQVSQTEIQRSQQNRSHTPRVQGHQQTSDPLSLWHQHTSSQPSQTSVLEYQQTSLQLPHTPGVQGHQQNVAQTRMSYNSEAHHLSDENLSNLLLNGVVIEETQPQPPYYDEDIKMIIPGTTTSEDVTNEYSFVSVPSASPYNPDVDDRGEPTLVSTNDPMLGQGHPNVINPQGHPVLDPLAILQAANLGGDQAEFEQFQNLYPRDQAYFDVSEFTFDLSDSGVTKEKTVSDGQTVFSRELQSECTKPSYLRLTTDSGGNQRQHTEVSESDDRPAFKPEDFILVKKLIKEIYEIQRNGNGYSVAMSKKLEQLCEIRMSNRDTFLHMTLTHNQPNLRPIVNVIHSMKMPHLLNLTNDLQQTILHLAVVHDQPRLVAFLVAKGCDPMMEDYEGNNVIHTAVMCQSSLELLLDAIKSNDVACNLDAFNYDMQTALHLAVIYDSETSARLLLKHGASYNVRDSEGRTPLHLATYDDYLGVARALLDSVLPSDVDAVDRAGRTALQIACEGDIRKNSIEIIKLLLEKGADPFKQDGNKSAMELARRRPAMWEVVLASLAMHAGKRNDRESDDEFLSADEGESEDQIISKLQEMKLENNQEK